MKKTIHFLLAVLMTYASPLLAQTQRVVETPSLTTSTVLQSAVTANGNGTVLDASGYSVVVLLVNCSSCSGGTTVNFEGSPNNSNFDALPAGSLGASPTYAGSTTTSGVTIWRVPLDGVRYIRARVSAYSAGTITVTAYASMAQPGLETTLPLPSGAATESTLSTLNGKVTAVNTGAVTISAALPAGTNAIGKLAANSGVDIGDVDVTSLPAITGTVTANAGTNLNTSALALDATVTGRLPAGASPADNESNTNANLSRLGSFTFVFDGSTWDRWTGAVSQSGTWNVTNVSGTVSLPTGAATLAEQQTQTTALQLIDDVVHTSDAALSKVAAIGAQLDDTSPGTTTENNVRPLRMSTRRELYGQIRDAAGNERGANVTAGNALVVDGSASTQPVSGTVSITANSAVNVAQINGVTPLMGAGNTGTGSHRVTIATDQAALVGLGIYAEDVGETAGGNLAMAGSVRRDVAASSAGTTGDNATLNTNASGALWVSQVDPCSSEAKTTDPISITTDTVIIAAAASKKNYICALVIVAGAAEIASVTEGTGSVCATSEAALVGSTTDANGMSFAANGGLSAVGGNATVIAGKTANVDTCLNVSGTNRVSGFVTWVQR